MDMMSENVSSSSITEELALALDVPEEADGVLKRSASLMAGAAAFALFSPFMPSKPVAMTVTIISSSIESSNAAPQMMFASSLARSVMSWEAVSISSSAISGEDLMLMMTPFAPAIAV